MTYKGVSHRALKVTRGTPEGPIWVSHGCIFLDVSKTPFITSLNEFLIKYLATYDER